MGYTVEQLLKIAETEVGYLEKANSNNLDNKTANAGEANYTKYARDLNLAGYYDLNGYAWCDMFTDWCFYTLCDKDKEKALTLTCQAGNNGAGCAQSMRNYKKANRFFAAPLPGDQIFFDWQGDKSDADHTGLVIAVDNEKVYTIEGNTGPMRGLEDEGDGVYKKWYYLTSTYIVGYGRPLYEEASNSYESFEQNTEAVQSATEHNFFIVKLKAAYSTEASAKVTILNNKECDWSHTLINLSDNSVIIDELPLSSNNLNNIALTGLKPYTPYALKIIANTTHLQSSQQLFFSTVQDYPNSIRNLSCTFDMTNNKCKIKFDSPKTWGKYGLRTKGYRVSLIINGVVISSRDDLIMSTAGSINTTIPLSAFKDTVVISYGDIIQVGVQTWVKDSNGDIILNRNGPSCSQPFCIKSPLVQIDKFYMKIANNFKRIALWLNT